MGLNIKDLQAKHDELESALKAFRDLEKDKVTAEQIADAEAKAEEFETIKGELKAAKLQAAKQANDRISGLLNSQNTGAQPTQPDEPKRITVPAKARAHASLKAFDSEESAYISGHCIAAGIFGNQRSKAWLENHGIYGTAFSENVDQKGGIFVPTEMSLAIIRLVEQFGVFRREARVEPMSSSTKVVPVRTAGMTAYAVGESDASSQPTGTQSSADYKPIELVARKWKVRTKVSDELNEDSLISIAEQVALESAQAFADKEDDCGFNGTGTSTYHGIQGLAGVLAAGSTFTMGTGDQAFSDVTLNDLETLMGKLPLYPGIRPKWFISSVGYHNAFLRLKNAAGGNTNDTLANGSGPTFLGYPVVLSQKMYASTGDSASTFIAYFGDLSMAALFGDRRDMTLSVDTSVHWDEDMVGIKATERFDIKIHSPGDATNAGPIVGLKTNAS